MIESEMCVFDMSGEPIHTVKGLGKGGQRPLYQVVCMEKFSEFKKERSN